MSDRSGDVPATDPPPDGDRPSGRGGPQQIPRPSSARPGPPAPWPAWPVISVADVVKAVVDDPGGTLDPAVDGHPTPDAPPDPGRPSAVLCAVFEEDGQAHVVLTRRSGRLRSHTGEVSLPGGRLEVGEDAIGAARREAWEEVALDPGSVTPVGRLPTLSTAINPSPITPIVATLPGRPELVASPAEVERVFTVPLAELVAPGVHHSELWAWPDGEERLIHFFELVGDTVWGATARMLVELLDRLATVIGG